MFSFLWRIVKLFPFIATQHRKCSNNKKYDAMFLHSVTYSLAYIHCGKKGFYNDREQSDHKKNVIVEY